MGKKEEKKIYILSIVVLFLSIVSTAILFIYINHVNVLKVSPYNVVISDIQPNSAVISWRTEIDTPTYIKLNESDKLLGTDELSKFHRVKVIDLDESTPYNFSITNGKREWSMNKHDRAEGNIFVQKYTFETSSINEEIPIPEVKELHVLPNELVYVSLYNPKNNEYSEIKSYYANKFGGIAVDIKSFEGEWEYEDTEIRSIDYFSMNYELSIFKKVYAGEVNCNMNVPNQKINGVTREQFAQLATRWVAGRGRHYARECFNDVVYRSRMAGVDPAFTLAVWLNESGASNYTQDKSSYGYIEDWGIHGKDDVPPQNFSAQLNHFLKRGHYNICPGLTRWEAWGNIYRWGTCNTDNPVSRQQGIDYYKRIEGLYRWITNGKNLPKKVTGLPIPINESEIWSESSNSLCCAIKLENTEGFVADFDSNKKGSDCNDLWKEGESAYSGIIQYAVEVPNRDANTCEVRYTGVCCQLDNDIKWYPKDSCKNVIEEINSSSECEGYAKEMSCFFRDGEYKWLPKKVGNDTVEGVSTKSQCISRNSIKNYTLKLKKGINFVGFDFTPVYHISPMYASTLLEMYKEILLIGNFQGYEWKDLVKQSEKIPFVGNDFYFEQNRGYLIVSNKDITIKLDGWHNPDVNYQELEEGWNLVGGSIFTNPSKGSVLISNMKESDIDVETVAVWKEDIKSFMFTDSDVKGVDISLVDNQGIFIKR